MQRWEYRVVSLRAGTYTASLNEYAREGWELLAVTLDAPDTTPETPRRSVPMPRALGQIEDAAAKLNRLGDSREADAAATALLWVLRRPVDED